MPAVRRARFVPTAIFLLLASVGLSGCASAVIGVGTAAVAASTTEKGFSTSVADTQIHAKLTDRFIKSNFSLVTAVDISVNDGAVLLTGKVKTPEEKILATKLTWEVRGVHEVVNELQITIHPRSRILPRILQQARPCAPSSSPTARFRH